MSADTGQRTMNRQVIPSMLLSVLIVCFFSVLLYERERPMPPAQRGSVRSWGGPEQESSRATAPALGQRAAPPEKPPETPGPGGPSRPNAPAIGPGNHVQKGMPETRPDSQPARPAGSAVPGEGPPTASDALGSGSGSGSAFTTVREGEALEDVSIRVYGSTDQVDALWRANRDLLPLRSSPLPSGSILRTPEQSPPEPQSALRK